jgi:hypothetical protein
VNPEYIRQPDEYSCGPTAIYNALLWAGYDSESKVIVPFLQFACQVHDPEDHRAGGTNDSDFDRVIRYVGHGFFTTKLVRNPTVESIKRHLKKGGSVCLGYYWDETVDQDGEHFCFFAGMSGNNFTVVNDQDSMVCPDKTVRNRTQKTVKGWMKKRFGCPTAWLLTKKRSE